MIGCRLESTFGSQVSENLAYKIHPGEGPYLALVHGFLSSSRQWKPNLAALGTVCTPVTIDLWGHGHSPAPSDPEAYHPDQYLAQFENIRMALGCEQWALCGYSLGAGLTIRYAIQHPERVMAHVFTNSQSGFADSSLLEEWRTGIVTQADRIRAGGHEVLERLAVHPSKARTLPEDVHQMLVEDADLLSPDGVAHTLEVTNLNATVRSLAADNQRPALLCYGTKEKRFAKSAAWAQAHMSELTVSEIEAGHGVNMENAEAFNTAVVSFLQDHQI